MDRRHPALSELLVHAVWAVALWLHRPILSEPRAGHAPGANDEHGARRMACRPRCTPCKPCAFRGWTGRRAGRAVAAALDMAFQRILCPVDFSPGSQQAMRIAAELANEHDAELALLHAWYLPPVAFSGEYMYPADVVQQLSDEAQRGIEAAVAEARALGVRRVTSQLLSGVPWQQIVDAARRDPAVGLIVIGTHGRSGLARVLLGSVAEMVVRHAPCPVMTVPLDTRPRPFSHVVRPVDPSARSHDAIDLAARLAQPGGAEDRRP
ncbi:MAG: universal stress protein [Deltaproteobacteria bacterium]|nr:MAG: universal stress protein [Deltaproteobacteria bacterium]